MKIQPQWVVTPGKQTTNDLRSKLFLDISFTISSVTQVTNVVSRAIKVEYKIDYEIKHKQQTIIFLGLIILRSLVHKILLSVLPIYCSVTFVYKSPCCHSAFSAAGLSITNLFKTDSGINHPLPNGFHLRREYHCDPRLPKAVCFKCLLIYVHFFYVFKTWCLGSEGTVPG
jgi:hypothetical protein